ncbi:MAG: carbamoyltransferase HypF, partial [Elusimicrobiaceae bacterium]
MIRKKIKITGVVQGIGFRPFIYRIAAENNISGFIFNSSEGVFIEAEGSESSVAAFLSAIRTKAPPASVLNSVEEETVPARGESGFSIVKSRSGGDNSAVIPADLALCEKCGADIKNPASRRYRYPFTNCTDCGPRFTIVKALPYDRPLTVMDSFRMCSGCLAEYENPADRRFHAQPNACPACGPRAVFIAGGRRTEGPDALTRCAKFLAGGKITAIKSLGGFHLACAAENSAAVAVLRARKNRPTKPFALMFESLAEVRKYCLASELEARALESSAAPGVTLKKRSGALDAVSPGLDTIAAMLPFTPLHAVLFDCLRAEGFAGPLVMTSANFRDEPVLYDDETLFDRLGGVFDGALTHNREIYNPCDDSIVYEVLGKIVPLRRARGYVPQAVRLAEAENAPASVFAAGGFLKNTFCITRAAEAFVSQHIGNLDGLGAEGFYVSSYEKLKSLLNAEPSVFARDMHPGYETYYLAEKLAAGRKIVDIQHHHAHIASVMAEHKLAGPVAGAAFDGTGFGPDGTVWGAEFLICEGADYERVGSLKPVRLPGADAAVSAPWRSAMSWLESEGLPARELFKDIPRDELDTVSAMLKSGFNSPLCSSMGRLFDAAAFFCG